MKKVCLAISIVVIFAFCMGSKCGRKTVIDKKKLLKINKEFDTSSKRVKAHVDKGKELFGRGLNNKAVTEYGKAIAILLKTEKTCAKVKDVSPVMEFKCSQSSGVLSMSYYFRGLIYTKQRKYDEAIQDFTKTLEIFPDNQAGFFRRGRAYSKKGSFDPAIKDLEKAIELLPKDPNSHYFLACVYSLQKKEKEALSGLDKAVSLVLGNADGSVKDINSIRMFWYNRLRKEADLKNIKRAKEFRGMLSNLRKRYRKK